MTTIEKTLIDDAWKGVRIGAYTILFGQVAKKVFGVRNPSTKMNVVVAGLLTGCIIAAEVVDNYALKKGWYKDKISS